jgi:hypothetical protein
MQKIILLYSLTHYIIDFLSFDTAKRLRQIRDFGDNGLNLATLNNFKLLNPIKYILSFGSAKPTKMVDYERKHNQQTIGRLGSTILRILTIIEVVTLKTNIKAGIGNV